MAAVCGTPIQACGFRFTLLDAEGDVQVVANNSFVSNKITTIGLTPDISAGADIEQRSGCDCIVASYKGADLFKRFTFEITDGAIEPAMLSLLTGGSLILDGSDPIGMNFPLQAECGLEGPPYVAFEFWQFLYNGGGPDATWPYVHWVFPMARFQFAPMTASATEMTTPSLTGFTIQNDSWGDGPYGDEPEPIEGMGAFFYTTDAPPAASCGFQTVVPA